MADSLQGFPPDVAARLKTYVYRLIDPRNGRAASPWFATFAHPHFTVTLPDLSELTIARLDRCFDELIPNPGRPGPGYP